MVAASAPLQTPLENSQGLPLNGFVNLINVLLGVNVNARPGEDDSPEPNGAPPNDSTHGPLPQGNSAQEQSSRAIFTRLEVSSGAGAQLAGQGIALKTPIIADGQPSGTPAGPRVASEANNAQALIRSILGARGAASGGEADSATLPSDTKFAKKTEAPVRNGSPKTASAVALPFEVAIDRASGDSASGNSNLTDTTPGANGEMGSGDASGATSGSGWAQSQTASALELANSQLSLAALAFSARLTPLDDNQSASEASLQDPTLPSPAPIEGGALDAEIRSKLVPQAGATSHDDSHSDAQDGKSQDTVPRVAAAAAAGDFARAFENPTQAGNARPQFEDAKTASAFGAVADTLRASESRVAEPASVVASGASPVQEIALRIAQPEMPSVDLRITERAGEIHVAVRTPDPALETALRADLGTLTSSLERAGYRTETFVPRESAGAPANGALNSAQSSHLNSGDDRQKQEPGSSGRQSSDSGNHRQPKRQRDPRPQDWLNEMEKQS